MHGEGYGSWFVSVCVCPFVCYSSPRVCTLVLFIILSSSHCIHIILVIWICTPHYRQVLHYVEKPETFVSNIINAGGYIFSPDIFQHLTCAFTANYENELMWDNWPSAHMRSECYSNWFVCLCVDAYSGTTFERYAVKTSKRIILIYGTTQLRQWQTLC